MKIGITQKLFLAIILAAGLAVISMVGIMHLSMKQGFLRYLNTMEKTGVTRLAGLLEDGYNGHGDSWEYLLQDPALWHQLIFASMPGDLPPAPRNPPPNSRMHEDGPPRGLPPDMVHQFTQRFFLLDANRKVLISQGNVSANREATPLLKNGKIIGYIGLFPHQDQPDPHQERFLKEQSLAFVIVAGIVLFLSTGLSLLLSHRLVQPLRSLAGATRHLAAGEFSTRVPVSSVDELGQLAVHFNMLAMTLEKNEQSRRQWVADISHELRTPISILRGEIEALQDGIRQPDPDSLRSLHGETLRLARLVDDLYQLAMSDLGALTYRKGSVDLFGLLQEMIVLQHPKFSAKGILLTTDFPGAGMVEMFGDAERLRQLFANLLDNSVKYTNAGGAFHLGMICQGRNVTINFQDSAPEVAEADMERVFERLFRVEASRSRVTGGAGLGLAICRNIVEAHQGKIWAQASPLGGLWVQVELPLSEC
ncbi:MAG: HAMP domain-containing protein [Chlorobium sp.]|jgi:two-component system sensor histidine kinase BaeS|nr:HAMP domain-containing protein [Chlorobium sp.]